MGACFIWLAASVSWSSVHSIARNCSSVQVIEHVNAAKNDEQPAHKSSMEKKMHFQNWGKSFSKPDRILSQNRKSKFKEGYWSEPPRCEPSGLLLASAIVVHGARHRRILRKGIQACFAIARNYENPNPGLKTEDPNSFLFVSITFLSSYFFLLKRHFSSFYATFSCYPLTFLLCYFFHSRAGPLGALQWR